MAKNTSISLGTYFENFVNSAIEEGRFKNVSEVVRAGLRLLEQEENKHQALRAALIEGKESGMIKDFDWGAHRKRLHDKYLDENGKLKQTTGE